MNTKLLFLASVGLFLLAAPISNVYSGDDNYKVTVVQEKTKTDADVTKDVKDAFANDKALSTVAKDVDVKVVDGVVFLTGKVDSEKAKVDVENKAKGVAGVHKVDNKVVVHVEQK